MKMTVHEKSYIDHGFADICEADHIAMIKWFVI